MDYDPGQEAAGGYPRAERLAHWEVARGRYEEVRLCHVGPPGALLWIIDRNWSDGNDKLWRNGRAPPGCAQLEARLLAKRTHEQVNCPPCMAQLRQERREQLGQRLLKKCQNEMMRQVPQPGKVEQDRQAKRKAAAEESAWEKDDKYANPSLVQVHSPFGQTLQLDEEGSCVFQMRVHCNHPKSGLEVEFVVKSLTGLVTCSLSLHHVNAKRGGKEKQTGSNHKRQRLDEEPSAVAAPAFASRPPQQDNFNPSASLDPTGPPPMGDDPTTGAMPPHPGNNTAVPPCPEAGHTGSSPFQGSPGNDGASEVQAITPGVTPFERDMTEIEQLLFFSLSAPSGSDGPSPTQLSALFGVQEGEAFDTMNLPLAEAEQHHPHDRSALPWFNDHHKPEGDLFLKKLGLCTSPSRYSGSSLDLEGSEEDALADSVHGSDSAQVSLTPPPIVFFFRFSSP
ncbi:uncharacterized protein ACA1_243590 [Acanthamoeba castellanii str. Neff]|uniref:Uncharacterized protein n=1 Tax=Acanthamoeba castellanii (strain ATCC 30010 / Neff) TaxID=1257118 RepID=L8GKM8_ACACF|nr:uncharacterized protein ACA1_243590 [Acanthamoeba castellanii str. Neff]ELR13399.1 hypothetical protein ACA1_243590 [Acanthamoeba castellanii str. Neff]